MQYLCLLYTSGYIVTIDYDMQYLGRTTFYERGNGFISDRQVDIAVMCFNERGNGFVNDRQVDIAVMGVSIRSVIACSILVWRLSTNLVMVSLTIGRLILRLWVYRYDRLWHAVPWSDSFL